MAIDVSEFSRICEEADRQRVSNLGALMPSASAETTEAMGKVFLNARTNLRFLRDYVSIMSSAGFGESEIKAEYEESVYADTMKEIEEILDAGSVDACEKERVMRSVKEEFQPILNQIKKDRKNTDKGMASLRKMMSSSQLMKWDTAQAALKSIQPSIDASSAARVSIMDAPRIIPPTIPPNPMAKIPTILEDLHKNSEAQNERRHGEILRMMKNNTDSSSREADVRLFVMIIVMIIISTITYVKTHYDPGYNSIRPTIQKPAAPASRFRSTDGGWKWHLRPRNQ